MIPNLMTDFVPPSPDASARYYADLNPRYGARYERRYAVWLRRSATDRVMTYLRFTTLRAAENAAGKLNSQERDTEVEA